MTSSLRLALAALLAGVVGVRAQVPSPMGPGASGNTAMVTGRVVAADGKTPIAAAIVSLAGPGRGGSQADRVLTNAQGQFFFADMPPARYTLTAAKPGWIDSSLGSRRPGGSSTPLEVEAGGRYNDVTLMLWQYATISGRVVDEAGEPVVGVDVRAFERRYNAGRPTYIPAGTRLVTSGAVTGLRSITDDRGMYRFSNLLPGDYIVAVPATVTTEPAGMAGAFRGGGPGANQTWLQTMSAVGTAPMFFDRAQGVASSDRWLVSSLVSIPVASGSADGASLAYYSTFHPAAATVESAAVVQAVSGRDRAGTDITLRLGMTYQVSGTLTAPEGSTAFHAVHLIHAGASEEPPFDVATAVTDETGAFAFHGVPPGSYIARMVRTPAPPDMRLAITGGTGAISSVRMLASGPNAGPPGVPADPLLSAEARVTVGSQSVRDLTLAARAGGRVTGRAAFEGSAAQPTGADWRRITVNLERAGGQGYANVLSGRFNEDGRFETPSTWPGRHLVRIGAPPAGWFVKSVTLQGRDVGDTPFDLSSDVSDVVVTFTDRETKIDGTVQGTDGKAGSGSVVLLFPTDAAGWVDYGRTSRKVRSVSSGSNGGFSFSPVPEGDYFLVAISDTDAEDWQNPTFLKRVAPLAERVQVAAGQTLNRTLRTRDIK